MAGGVGFQNSWVNYGNGYFPAAYRKVGSRVWLRGMIASGSGTTAAFTLPAGYRPQSNVRSGGDSSGGWASCVVNTGGAVIPTPAAPIYFSLDQVSFDTL